MNKTGNEQPILVKILQALAAAGATGMSTAELAAKIGAQAKAVSTAAWYQRKAERLTTDESLGRHFITDAGRSFLEARLSGVDTGRRRRSSRASSTVLATPHAAPRPPVTDRAAQAGRHADDLIANARAAIDVHEALLDESVELTPLVRSTIDGIRRSITLIESAYQVARA